MQCNMATMAAAFRATNAILGDVAAALEVPTDGLTFRGLLAAVIAEATAIELPFTGTGDFSKLVSIAEQVGVAPAAAAVPAAGVSPNITASVAAAAASASAVAPAPLAPPRAAAAAAAAAAGAAVVAAPAGAVAASTVSPSLLVSSSSDFPEEWAPFGDEGSAQDYAWERRWLLVALDPGSPEFASVQAQLLESMQGVTVVRVERIQHRLLWRRFAVKRGELRKKVAGLVGVGDSAAADLRLWHGTGETDPKAILSSESGLDERLSSQRGFYGRGVYLAEHARYSNGDSEVRVCVRTSINFNICCAQRTLNHFF